MFNGIICGPLLLKIIIRLATMDSRATIFIIHSQLNGIDSNAAGVAGDVKKITEFSTNNLDRLKESGANLNDEVDSCDILSNIRDCQCTCEWSRQ
jgi:hypothetical protein